MSRLFADIVNISYLASWLIVAVILFRCVMKRAPKWIELACDEMATACMDKEERADYCQTLLNYNVNRGMRTAVPLAFGEVGVKKRVKEVLRGKKPTFWWILVAIVIGIGKGKS